MTVRDTAEQIAAIIKAEGSYRAPSVEVVNALPGWIIREKWPRGDFDRGPYYSEKARKEAFQHSGQELAAIMAEGMRLAGISMTHMNAPQPPKPCPFCGAEMVEAGAFRTRTTHTFIHDAEGMATLQCPASNIRIIIGGDADAERLRRWNDAPRPDDMRILKGLLRALWEPDDTLEQRMNMSGPHSRARSVAAALLHEPYPMSLEEAIAAGSAK